MNLKNSKIIYCGIIILSIGIFLFWWYSIRVSKIIIRCNDSAIEKMEADSLPMSYSYETTYTRCLRANGVRANEPLMTNRVLD